MDIGLSIAAIVVLLMFSAFFSGSEIAYTGVNALRLRNSAESGSKIARLALYVHEHYEKALTTILVGNNLVNIAASSLTTLIAITLVGESATGLAGVIITVLLLLFGEITPKIVAKRVSDKFVLMAAFPLRVLMILFFPVVFLVEKLLALLAKLWKDDEEQPTITEEEFQQILETVEDEGVIDEDTTQLMQSAMEFDDITVEQVMTPRTQTVALDIDDDPKEMLSTILDAQYSRLPVYEDTIDHIIGILPANHFLKEMDSTGKCDVRSLLLKPILLHKTMTLDDATKRMRVSRTHMAIVTDEYGGTLGVVTMEDALEQLVGEIWDETDDIVEEFVQLGEDSYECAGSMSIHDFFDEADFEDKDFESAYTTLGGWAIEMLDAMPAQGKSFTYKGMTVTVTKMDGMRVDRLHITIDRTQDEEDEE